MKTKSKKIKKAIFEVLTPLQLTKLKGGEPINPPNGPPSGTPTKS